jgi:hypothetical protein
MAMLKAEIIERIVNDAVCLRSPIDDISNDEAGYSRDEIVAVLEMSLKKASPEERVRTCEDFSRLCCKPFEEA